MDVLIEPRLRKQIDWTLLMTVGLLMLCSLLAIWSATATDRAGLGTVLRQAAYFAVGLGVLAYFASRDYVGASRLAPFLYLVNLFFLVVVLLIGKHAEAKGAGRWIPMPLGFKLQPSEFAKVCIILTLGDYLRRLGPAIQELPNLLRTLVHVGIPMALIYKQPDMGTALVFMAIWLGMVFLAGANGRHLVAILLAGVVLFSLAWKFNVIHDYQKDRVLILLGLKRDPQGKGYHVEQSLTAVGGGQVTGQGLRHGIQTAGDFVPENHTDFIFTVVAEETGFVGACLLLAVYGILLWRGILTILESEDYLGRLIAGGVVALIAFHLMVNIGMTCGILPVVGVPLPLMSFGGSAAWTNLAAIGLLLSVHMRRRKLQF